jgi:hypothetical protein
MSLIVDRKMRAALQKAANTGTCLPPLIVNLQNGWRDELIPGRARTAAPTFRRRKKDAFNSAAVIRAAHTRLSTATFHGCGASSHLIITLDEKSAYSSRKKSHS